MATIEHSFYPFEATFADPASIPFPQPTARAPGSFSVQSLDYSDTVVEAAFFSFKALGYGSGNLTVDIYWWAATASSGDVVLGASIGAITPNVDTTSILSKALATEATVTDSHLGTVGARLHKATITITALDSLAADDWVALQIRRIATDAADTMTGDCAVSYVTLSYST